MSEEIILYDLPSPDPSRSWSGNVWKTRLALNFKNIPYKTVWVPYTQLQEKLKATYVNCTYPSTLYYALHNTHNTHTLSYPTSPLPFHVVHNLASISPSNSLQPTITPPSSGLSPNPPGSWSPYSVPTIRLPKDDNDENDGKYIMDSAAIAVTLESLHPHPSLHLNPALETEAQTAINSVFIPLAPYFLSIAIDKLVAPIDLAWFKADRAQRFGTTVQELETPKDADTAYAGAQAGFEQCREVLTKHKKDEGPYILGSVPCYADFYLVATMLLYSRIGGSCWERFWGEAGPEMRALFDACERWTVRQD